MQRKTVLILGGSGQLGLEMKSALAFLGKLIAPNRAELDLSDPDEVSELLQRVKPDIIVNAAAYTAVDRAESEPEVAWALNVGLVRCLVAYVSKRATLSIKATDSALARCQLIHFSTDYVYHSSTEQKLTETDFCAPLSVYGQTKLAADNEIQGVLNPLENESSLPLYFIFRISWVVSERRHNFMKTMLRLASTHRSLEVVDDQVGAPITARLVADVALLALMANIPAGVYNLTCSGETSWAQFAQVIFAKARELNIVSETPKVIPVSSQVYSEGKNMAPRPLNSRLNTEKLEAALSAAYNIDWQLPEWSIALYHTLQVLEQCKVKE